ncbi:unnamed protein product [Pleuronectes platessa]|uniref:Uncharacterized protein n=1 Tax=Pleuronectes platessa TaxID=8262 RepID=A0A9N7V4S1_PLEPL|nr:unnamed protein product [Pleuronectes platessa]
MDHVLDVDWTRSIRSTVWEVSNSLKKRAIEFEARQILKSPKTRPPQFKDPRIISLAQEYSSILKEQQQPPLTSKHLGPKACPRRKNVKDEEYSETLVSQPSFNDSHNPSCTLFSSSLRIFITSSGSRPQLIMDHVNGSRTPDHGGS